MERMLINATQPEELRVALAKDNVLYDLDIEKPSSVKKKANIYKGIIRRIEPSLEAAFVEYGAKRQGFLPLREISPAYYSARAKSDKDQGAGIKDLIRENQEIMIQIDKEERGTKGAALTTYISLAGCYLVLMPNNARSGGISRRIEGEDRDELREKLRGLNTPEGMGAIIRTSGVGKSLEDLQWDLSVLVNQWQAIQAVYTQRSGHFLIHQEGDVIIRSIRDNLRKSIEEIIIDNQEAYVKARNYIEQVNPSFLNHVKLYNDTIPLFSRHQIESQIETAYQREIALPSGGAIIIDHAEALVAIDINSAKATSGTDIEATAFNTNLEAANEIARQLRLRDLGGLIVIDFIDMSSSKNQREIENKLREALRPDRARIQVSKISNFGLLEMSRQRIRLSLGESSHETCPRCDGQGIIRKVQSLMFSILRLIEERALIDNVKQIQVQLPVSLATYILNEKREAMFEIEKRHSISILILPNPHLEPPHYKIKHILHSERSDVPSHKIVRRPELETIKTTPTTARREEPAVKLSTPIRRKQSSWLKRLWNTIFSSATAQETKTKQRPQARKDDDRRKHPPRRHRSGDGHRDDNRRRRAPRKYSQSNRRGGRDNPKPDNKN
ncbi:MAG: Rne/Rng family ribonuclease [Gammaproteobacteria bacterium]